VCYKTLSWYRRSPLLRRPVIESIKSLVHISRCLYISTSLTEIAGHNEERCDTRFREMNYDTNHVRLVIVYISPHVVLKGFELSNTDGMQNIKTEF